MGYDLLLFEHVLYIYILMNNIITFNLILGFHEKFISS